MNPSVFEALVENFRKLPGVGLKSAERYAFECLKWSNEDTELFIRRIEEAKKVLGTCQICGNMSEGDLCEVCKDQTRDKSIICVVESIKDVMAMEKINEYHGLYHVLDGVISTTKGIMPDDLNIDSLIERIDENVKEIIIATNPTVEGETTALYLSKLLNKKKVNVTRLAYGLPMGGHLDYADELTLIKAMEGRKKIGE